MYFMKYSFYFKKKDLFYFNKIVVTPLFTIYKILSYHLNVKVLPIELFYFSILSNVTFFLYITFPFYKYKIIKSR